MNGYPDDAGFVAGSETSRATAASLDPYVSGMRREVYELFQRRGKLSCFQVEAEFPEWAAQSASARISELVLKGYLRDTGEKQINPNGIFVKVYDLGVQENCPRKAPNRYVGHSSPATRRLLYDGLVTLGSATYDELIRLTGLKTSVVTSALADMKLLRQAIETGRKGKTDRGKPANILIAGVLPPGDWETTGAES